jgi:hypothetical protein
MPRREGLSRIARFVLPTLLAAFPGAALAAGGQAKELLQEIEQLHQQNLQNEERIKQLEQKVNQLQASQEEQTKQVEAKVEEASGSIVSRAVDRYFGQDRFVLTGYGFARYNWNDNENSNSFLAGFNPIFLYRLNDEILFEGEVEFGLESNGDTHVHLEYAQIDYLLNDYATLVAGEYLLPFGEFIERLHPAWINRLVTHPLPFREGDEGGLLPFSDVGLQVRGGVPLGYGIGTHLGYTVYLANGPRYESDDPGALFVNNQVDSNRNKAVGARLDVYPLPLDWKVGWLQLGGSTYDGKWDSEGTQWFTSWGLDWFYWYKEFQLRGEYVSTRRALEGPTNDTRNGWYIQGSYQLASLAPAPLDRLELVTRYSRQDQRFVPEDGDEEFLPHPRQVSIGLNYWITPSFAAKLEYDRDIPNGAENNNEIWTELALGF